VDAESSSGRFARHPSLEGFSPSGLQVLAGNGQVDDVAQPDTCPFHGEPAEQLCLLPAGSAGVSLRRKRGSALELATVGPGWGGWVSWARSAAGSEARR
jgi:hypothetical protein